MGIHLRMKKKLIMHFILLIRKVSQMQSYLRVFTLFVDQIDRIQFF